MENYEFDNLLYAAASGDLEGIAKWIKEGAGVNNQDDRGYTPLMLAARMGRTDSVTLLLENGADPGIRDNLGKTAARIAMEAGFEDISGKIEKAAGEKSDFEIPEVVKETAIETFVMEKASEIRKKLDETLAKEKAITEANNSLQEPPLSFCCPSSCHKGSISVSPSRQGR